MKKAIVAIFITLLLSSCYTKYEAAPNSADTPSSQTAS
ncbi:lipoprotein [Francisella sp. SYW-9]|nr:lipoprotein [Francisella sp. SYW-9]